MQTVPAPNFRTLELAPAAAVILRGAKFLRRQLKRNSDRHGGARASDDRYRKDDQSKQYQVFRSPGSPMIGLLGLGFLKNDG